MEFITYSFREGLELVRNDPAHNSVWNEVAEVINSISDADLRNCIERRRERTKSLSSCINSFLKKGLTSQGWIPESRIFQSDEFDEKCWRLDFAKPPFSIEVAFNHGEAIAWNLTKPVLASELNHVEKAIQTRFGIVICATSGLKSEGGFDGAVGEYEKVLRYLKPLRDLLRIPVIVVGLLPPRSFYIEHGVRSNNRKFALVRDGTPSYWRQDPPLHLGLPTSDR